jgi:hypothetical protein
VPYGEHLAYCVACGKTWVVGDCIPFLCPECECEERGHLWVGGGLACGRCGAPLFRDAIPARRIETGRIDNERG